MAKSKSRFREQATEEDLLERTEQSYNNREQSGKFNDYLTDDMPLTKWKCTEGGHILDVIPFIAGDKHPNVAEGKPTHNVDLYVHFGIGVTESSYICPARMGTGPCPICEYQAELKKLKGIDEEFIKGFNAKRRVLYNIVCYDTPKDEAEGVQLWEASHHLSEKKIMAVAKNNRTGSFIKWASPDVGKTIEFSREGKSKNTSYEGLKFTDRDAPITDDDLDDAIAIDQFLDFKTYDELKDALGNVELPGEDKPLEESYEDSGTPTAEKRTPRTQRTPRTEKADPEPNEIKEIVEPDKEEAPVRRGRRNRGAEPEKTEEPGKTEEPATDTGTTIRRRGRRNI